MPLPVVARANTSLGRVVRSRAPLRLGLAGGGTDLSPYADIYGGVVVNVTIDRFCYANLSEHPDGLLCFEATDHQTVYQGDLDGELPYGLLPLHAGVYARVHQQFNLPRVALTLSTFSDVPSGSGLGGSSTLIVAMLEAFREFYSLPLDDYELANLAWSIEREDLGLAGGRQDQFAAAFGGFNVMEFGPEGRVLVQPLRLRDATVRELESSLVLYFTGTSRESANVVSAQAANLSAGDETALLATHQLRDEALAVKEALLRGNLNELANSVERGWLAKKATSAGVSNSDIERVRHLAVEAGAITGKISGGGGGGFIWFLVDPVNRAAVLRALSNEPGHFDFCHFTQQGVVSWTVR